MEEIFYLESDEEITSVIDKLKQAKSSQIHLVVPREATLLQSVVNLKLLLKEANNLEKEIALVTADKIGKSLAAQVGLTVYDSVRDKRPSFQPSTPPPQEEIIEIDMREQKEPSQIRPKGVKVHHFQEKIQSPPSTNLFKFPSKPKVGRIDWPKAKKIIWPMLGIVILLLLIGAFLILPKVEVKIKVKSEDYEQSLDAQISDTRATSIDQKIYKGTLLDLTKEKEEKFIATGKKNLGGKASGTITLYNYWDSNPQSLGTSTKFSSSSKTFISKSSATIPGTSIRGGNIVPGTVTAEIEAEEPGEEYNVKAGRFTIVGLSSAQQEKIYGQSSKDLSGGFTKEVTIISQNDYDQAKEKLIKDLNQELEKELNEKVSGLEVVEKAIENETVEEQSSVAVEAEADEFTLKIKQKMRVMVFNKDSLDQFVFAVLERRVPYDKMLSLGPKGEILPTKIETDYDQKILNLTLNVKAKISSRVDIDKVKKDLLGKSKSDSDAYLNNLSGIAGFDVNYIPKFWLKRIPNYEKMIKVELEYIHEISPTLISPQATASPIETPTLIPETSL